MSALGQTRRFRDFGGMFGLALTANISGPVGTSHLGHKRTSGNFPEADGCLLRGDVDLALPKGHSAPTVGVTVARRRIQSLPEGG